MRSCHDPVFTRRYQINRSGVAISDVLELALINYSLFGRDVHVANDSAQTLTALQHRNWIALIRYMIDHGQARLDDPRAYVRLLSHYPILCDYQLAQVNCSPPSPLHVCHVI